MSTEISRETRRQELASMKFGVGQLFQPKDGRELMDMANLMSTAGLMVKDIYRGNPGACMGLIATLSPYGINPLQASWKTYQTKADAPIAYEAQLIVAMLNSSGAVKGGLRYRYEGEGQNRVCVCTGTLVGSEEVLEVTSPPLSAIFPKNSPLWKSDPDQQLAYYTGRAWARRYKPEMLLGVYDVDEVESFVGPENAKDVTPKTPKPGRAVYVDEARQEPPHDEDGVIPDDTSDAEIVETDEQRAARELHETADAKAGEGVIAFREWWGTLDPAARSEVAKRSVAYKEKAEAADAAKAPADPFADSDNSAPDEGDVSGRQVNFETILRAIQHEMIGGNVAEDVRGMYQEELAAMEKQRPELYAEAEKALAGAAA